MSAGCYGCDDTGSMVWASMRGQPCLCRTCSECEETADKPIETLDVDDRGNRYAPCAGCLAEERSR